MAWHVMTWLSASLEAFSHLLPSSCNRRFCRCQFSDCDLLKSSLTAD